MSVSVAEKQSSSENATGTAFAVLDLPKETTWSMDGKIAMMKRNDFLGFHSIPSNGRFHLVTLRHTNTGITQGFMVMSDSNSDGFLMLHRYSPLTEEVPATQIQDELTRGNFQKQLAFLGQQQMVAYDRMHTEEERKEWFELTKYISIALLHKRGIQHASKVVPGAYTVDEDFKSDVDTADGTPIQYPPIPCVGHGSLSAHRHQGTKLYLSKLAPKERTVLLTSDDPGGEILNELIRNNFDNKWEYILGDLQMSFVIFLHLQCFASFQHW